MDKDSCPPFLSRVGGWDAVAVLQNARVNTSFRGSVFASGSTRPRLPMTTVVTKHRNSKTQEMCAGIRWCHYSLRCHSPLPRLSIQSGELLTTRIPRDAMGTTHPTAQSAGYDCNLVVEGKSRRDRTKLATSVPKLDTLTA